MFCVYGIDVKEAHARAQKRWQNEESKYQKKLLTRSSRAKKPIKKPRSFESHLKHVLSTIAIKKISTEYSSPRNAQDFITFALEKNSEVVGRLKIMVWDKKLDAEGNVRLKKDGSPMMGFIEWVEPQGAPNGK